MPVRIPFVSGLPALAAMLLLLPGVALSVETESSNGTSSADTVAAETAAAPSAKREPDPIPPLAAAVSDAESMQRVPDDLLQRVLSLIHI